MTAWTKLLSVSSLTSGTAWALISNPKSTGSGLIVSDGVVGEVADMDVEVTLMDESLDVEVLDQVVELLLNDNPIEVEVSND